MEIINLERAEILVVDDNPLNIKILSSLLNKHGYVVRAAHSGEEALLEVSQSHPDLILLDIMMPDLSGYEVCCQLRKNTSTAKIPIIFLRDCLEIQTEAGARRLSISRIMAK